MSSRFSRPRRTRLYDTAYNIGESYYKPTLDSLDRKQYGKPETSSILTSTPRPRLDINNTFDEDLQGYRARAQRAITEDPIFDSRGTRVNRSIQFPSAYGNDDLDEDVQASLGRIRSNRKNVSSLINELDLDDSFSTIKRRGNINLGEKLMNIDTDDDLGASIRSRGLRMVTAGIDDNDSYEPGFKSRTRNLKSRLMDDDSLGTSAVSSYKRTVISSDIGESVDASAASMRAKASKARLADLESEMFDRSEKQMEREQRSLNLKKLLADIDTEEVKPTKKMLD